MSYSLLSRAPVREWRDAETGRRVRQLTDLPGGAELDYFRLPCQLPDGLLLALGKHADGDYVAIDPEAGCCYALPLRGKYLKLNEQCGRLWLLQEGRRVVQVDLPDGQPEVVADLPSDLPGVPEDITCDGRLLLVNETQQDLKRFPPPFTKDAEALWRYLHRPRSSWLRGYDLASGQVSLLVATEGVGVCHVDSSPVDPTLVRFAHDSYATLFQRIWSVRTDGSDLHPIRPQIERDMVMHEFWWPGAQRIAYKLQRRIDDTFHDLPWGEYAPVPTHFCLATLDGTEVYRSAALNGWHTHVFASQDGQWLCGEGTDGDSFVYAAPFSPDQPRIEFQRYATVHTAYVPMAGQCVNTTFSADDRWLLFNDRCSQHRQICAVRVDEVSGIP